MKKTTIALLACMGLIALADIRSASPLHIQGPSKTIDRWLDYDFDSGEPMGSAKNPAVILPAATAALFGDLPAARRAGDMLLIPVAEFQKAANQPFAQALLAPVLSQLTNVKSFDGFSAIDTTGLIKGLSSELHAQDAIARRVSGENLESYRKLLRKGDLVFGSHVVNWMTWGKYIHVAIVADAARGTLIEATADGPTTDKPGVREVDWTAYTGNYGHIGVVRVRRASDTDLARVVRWVEDKKGRPYRWPILMGLDNNDETRFYCSQLVWRAYKQVINLDLDSDRGALVFPDDLYFSKDHVDIIVP